MVAWRYGISLVFNSVSHSFTELTHEMSSWTLAEKSHISACRAFLGTACVFCSPHFHLEKSRPKEIAQVIELNVILDIFFKRIYVDKYVHALVFYQIKVSYLVFL